MQTGGCFSQVGMMAIHIRSRKTILTQSGRRLLWGCLLAAIPGSLFAVDGVVLIDQSHALAGSITPGDAPGFPVTITQPGSYRFPTPTPPRFWSLPTLSQST